MRKLTILLAILVLPLLVMSDDIMVVGNKLIRTGSSAVTRQTVPWTPAMLTNTVAWYDAADASTITESGGNVSQWDDKSGNGYNLSQSSGSKQPDYVTNAINGLASLYYSSTLDQMYTNLASSVNVTNLTMIAVGMGATGDWPAYGYVKSTDVTDSVDHRHQSGSTSGKINVSFKIDGTSANAPTANSADLAEYVPCISIVYYDGAKTVSRANGGSLTAENTGAPDGATFTIDRIQCGRQSNTPKNYQGEYIILDTADLVTIQKVEGYLAWKWGIQSKLPVSHPYKNKYPTVPVWTPADIATIAWYDAADASTITMSGGKVSQWDDKSDNANHLVQTTGSKQPTYISSDPLLNNYSTIYSEKGVSEYFNQQSSTPQAVNRAYFVIYYADGVTNKFYNHPAIFASTDNNPRLTGRSGDDHVFDGSRASQNFDFTGSFQSRNGDTNNSWYTDNGLPINGEMFRVTTVYTNKFTNETWRVLQNNTATWGTWWGGIGELIFTDGSEDLDTQQKMEGYLAWRWGIENKLPSYHPYKYHQPIKE